MYWDTFTAAGFIVSIVLILCAFYLELRKRPVVPQDYPQQS
jgi:hypothetical protein